MTKAEIRTKFFEEANKNEKLDTPLKFLADQNLGNVYKSGILTASEVQNFGKLKRSYEEAMGNLEAMKAIDMLRFNSKIAPAKGEMERRINKANAKYNSSPVMRLNDEISNNYKKNVKIAEAKFETEKQKLANQGLSAAAHKSAVEALSRKLQKKKRQYAQERDEKISYNAPDIVEQRKERDRQIKFAKDTYEMKYQSIAESENLKEKEEMRNKIHKQILSDLRNEWLKHFSLA
eukprot:CAMPEP_0174274554 /NCGR_PEP_ID=MMETSP0439-20130205/58340_1 /TAXON_ID=0 /ORGANISM="Stereomyxa ramosa, Strain Chinc5" /LENGTH=233 /DNA_ID=CAMNT_0015366375 /DNA_START=487 /DNA_END=1185 /DNA_ORIENTATION=-